MYGTEQTMTGKAPDYPFMHEPPNPRDRTTLGRPGAMAKYTKLLPPEEYDKLTLEEKADYISAMAELLKRL